MPDDMQGHSFQNDSYCIFPVENDDDMILSDVEINIRLLKSGVEF